MMEKDLLIKKDGMDSKRILNKMIIQVDIKMDNMLEESNMEHNKVIKKVILIKDLIKILTKEQVIKDINTEEINTEVMQGIKIHLVIIPQLLITY